MATDDDPGRATWLFLLGVTLFLGSVVLLVADLVRGVPIARGVVLNAVGALLLVAVATRETFADDDSSIETRLDAFRASVFFVSVYLIGAGVVLLVVGLVASPPPRLGAFGLVAGILGTGLVYLTSEGLGGLPGRVGTLVGGVGLLVFFASVVLFAYDLWAGQDVLRAIAANAAGAALFLLWSAFDMPADPDSRAETLGEASGAVFLFYGVYLGVAGVVLAATLWLGHDYRNLALWYIAMGAITTILGLFLSPTGASGNGHDDGGTSAEK
jgi:hypothetical protein